MRMYVQGDLSSLRYHRPQARPKPNKFDLVCAKLTQVRARHYIQPGHVLSLTDYFDVPKGPSDVRMVYNGSSCGLNTLLWAPSFWLPNTITATRLLTFSSFSVDLDLGEMFLNFPLDPLICPYAGVDLSPFGFQFREVASMVSPPHWERWECQFMGLRPSPVNSVRFYYWAEEFAWGSRNGMIKGSIYRGLRTTPLACLMYINGINWINKLLAMWLLILMTCASLVSLWKTHGRWVGNLPHAFNILVSRMRRASVAPPLATTWGEGRQSITGHFKGDYQICHLEKMGEGARYYQDVI